MTRIPVKIPTATYRIQFHREFTFKHAAKLAPYLKRLGISHLYASPLLEAVSGSPHGYDIVDYGRINPELGGAEGFERLRRALQKAGLGLVLDIVPNHMAAQARQNPWWRDVLRRGRASPFAGYFDIDWEAADPKIRGKVLIPVLGDRYARCLSAGQIRLKRFGARISVCYFEHEFPLSPPTLADILAAALQPPALSGPGRMLQKPMQPPAAQFASGAFARQTEGAYLQTVLAKNPEAGKRIDKALATVNAQPELLDRCLEAQHYRLAWWRTAAGDINYRRFFDINDLVGICTEKETVFREAHRLVLSRVKQGDVDGLRIDHPDGLRNPKQYLKRLRKAAPRAWIVAEKILAADEELPRDWLVSGTTGYDFLSRVGGLFVDAAGEVPLTTLYAELTGEATDFAEIVRLKKHQVLTESFASEISRLTSRLVEIRRRHRRYRDLTRRELQGALAEIIACFPVYRTYICAEEGTLSPQDRRLVETAVARAGLKCSGPDREVWAFFKDLLLLRLGGEAEADFVMRLQQFTGPAMAKGVEDTAFYCFNRLISLNEVGDDPGRFGVSLEEFHRYCADLQTRWPGTMLTTATHDTKRGEDARLRIYLLSEIPERWSKTVRQWFSLNARFRHGGLPDANTEYFLYQTLVGTWPIGADRLVPYMLKAVREAKTHTSWTEPSTPYEEALQDFTEKILAHERFRKALERFLGPLLTAARIASLSQALIRCTAPGVPDLYQGADLWDLSLVDPDNRRPVDFNARQRLLATLDRLSIEEIRARAEEGLPKLFVLKKALAVRRLLKEAFGPESSYEPLPVRGAKSDHAVAFVRGKKVLTLAPRLLIGLGKGWGDTVLNLPQGTWRNALTGEGWQGGSQPISKLLKSFPVGLFVHV